MSTPNLKQLPGMVLLENEPVFNEPWEAKAFALVIELYNRGAFSWSQWAEVLAKVIAEDKNSRPYYELWLEALELITRQSIGLSMEEISRREADWKAALDATPHGEPVELNNGHK